MNNNYILILLFIAVIYLYTQNKSIKENMANTESIKEQIEEGIKEYYKADVNAIRNLAEISTKLQKGTLTIPGNLRVEGELIVDNNLKVKKNLEVVKNLDVNDNLKVKKDLNVNNNLNVGNNSNVKGITTINKLYGGQSTGGGWRDIIVHGGHIRFVVNNNKFGFNGNSLYYYTGNTDKPLPIWKGIHAQGNIYVDDLVSTKRLAVKIRGGILGSKTDSRRKKNWLFDAMDQLKKRKR